MRAFIFLKKILYIEIAMQPCIIVEKCGVGLLPQKKHCMNSCRRLGTNSSLFEFNTFLCESSENVRYLQRGDSYYAVAKPARQFGHVMQIFPCS
jgi:hypothetical protein